MEPIAFPDQATFGGRTGYIHFDFPGKVVEKFCYLWVGYGSCGRSSFEDEVSNRMGTHLTACKGETVKDQKVLATPFCIKGGGKTGETGTDNDDIFCHILLVIFF
jgi:hypothetical protein